MSVTHSDLPQALRLALAAAAAITLGLSGCQSDSSNNAAGGTPPAKKTKMKAEDLPAPEAWKKLESDAKRTTFLGGLQMPGGSMANSWTHIWEQRKEEANQKVDQAMQSDLPSKAIDAMVDSISQTLTTELTQIPSVKAAPHKVFLAFGQLASDNSPQMAQALDSMKEKLFNNQEVSQSFIIVTSSEDDANKLIQKVAGNDLSVFRDPLQQTPDETRAKSFNPQFIYLVSGKIFPTKDVVNHSISVTMTWSVEHLQTRKVEKILSFNKTYMWHPYRNAWELQP